MNAGLVLHVTFVAQSLLGAVLCPFCSAPEPTWAERRDQAEVVALIERPPVGEDARPTIVHRVLKGPLRGEGLTERLQRGPPGSGGLGLILGERGEEPDTWRWDWIATDEASLVYALRAPATTIPAVERLPYFIPFLEHADPALAGDAYAEFGRAPFDAVAGVVDRVPMADVRSWLVDPQVPDERKGLYGLLLGLAERPKDQRLNRRLLEAQIAAEQTDFRAGFDGILGGYLHLAGESGLERIERQILNHPTARRGDLLHAHSALRVYHEFGRGIAKPRLAAALARLLERPECAAAATIDLARWQAWDQLPRVARLWREQTDDRELDRAIVGFLTHAPTDEARQTLQQFRQAAPARVEQAERALQRFRSTAE